MSNYSISTYPTQNDAPPCTSDATRKIETLIFWENVFLYDLLMDFIANEVLAEDHVAKINSGVCI